LVLKNAGGSEITDKNEITIFSISTTGTIGFRVDTFECTGWSPTSKVFKITHNAIDSDPFTINCADPVTAMATMRG